MSQVSAKVFVDAEISAALRAQIPSALKTAYEAVDVLYQSEPIFQVMSARFGKGHVIGWAVDLHIERLIKLGKLPFDYRWAEFEKPTGRFLQIRLPASTLSINQLPEPDASPRHAFFRHNRVLNNAPFLAYPEFDVEREIEGLPHLILGHGYQQLTFAHVGVPHPDARRFGWIYRTPNLLMLPHVVASTEPSVEAVEAEAVVTLREDLNRWIRDHTDEND